MSAVSREQAAGVIRTLVAAFDALVDRGNLPVAPDRVNVIELVAGWWAWIVGSSKVVLWANEAGLGHEAAPNVRSILEHGLVLQWVVDDPSTAVPVVASKAANDRRKLSNDVQRQNWSIPDGVSAPDPVTGSALDFASLCALYNAESFYIPYRMLSSHVHPTAKGAEAYLTRSDGSSVATAPSHADLVLVAICLIQTFIAVDSLTVDKPLAASIAAANGVRVEPIERPVLRRRGRSADA